MPPEPVPQDPGRDEDPRPVPPWPDWMDDPAYLAVRAGDEEPGDPGLARDLAEAAARNPRSTWCVTVTDQDGHAVGHGCARRAARRNRTDTIRRAELSSP
jgi:hypothetical protein